MSANIIIVPCVETPDQGVRERFWRTVRLRELSASYLIDWIANRSAFDWFVSFDQLPLVFVPQNTLAIQYNRLFNDACG